jgi:ribonuclease HI
MAVREAVEFCKDVGLQDVILEGDSLQVIQAFKDQGENFRPYGQVVDDAKSIMGRTRSWMSCNAKRDANMTAHGLAKFRLSYP